MRWSEFAACQPALAAVAHDQLIGPGVVLIGTTRRDDSARISGVEPLVIDGELWLSVMPASAKARDLDRDPRILVHSVVTSPSPQAEIMMRGTVRAETSREVQQRYAAAVEAGLGWRPVSGEFILLAVDISDVTYIGHDAGTNAQHLARWPAGEEYLRPVLTPTSLGPREPVGRLLAHGSQA
jgi:general stress protein 26